MEGGPRGLVFSPGWYGVVLEAQVYTRHGGTNMIQTNNGCQGRRITETTAARGDDPKTTAARGVDISGIIETGIIVTGMTVTGVFLYTRDLDWYHWIDWCDSTDARGDIRTSWYAGIINRINTTPSTGLRSHKFNFVYIFWVTLLILFIVWSYRHFLFIPVT